MDCNLYKEIFKRKSFHLFRNVGDEKISKEELDDIIHVFKTLERLNDSIQIDIRIVSDETNCKRGQEYTILFYSEKKNNYLENIGYVGEQLDLYLASKNIGTLWYGIGRTPITEYNGLEYVIMLAIKKISDETKYLKDMYKSKRKDLSIIWHSTEYQDIGNIVRFAPSACNTQPWDVTIKNKEILIKRITKKRGIMPQGLIKFYNSIDIGIFLCFMELCFMHKDISFERILLDSDVTKNEVDACKYIIKE